MESLRFVSLVGLFCFLYWSWTWKKISASLSLGLMDCFPFPSRSHKKCKMLPQRCEQTPFANKTWRPSCLTILVLKPSIWNRGCCSMPFVKASAWLKHSKACSSSFSNLKDFPSGHGTPFVKGCWQSHSQQGNLLFQCGPGCTSHGPLGWTTPHL